MGPKKQFLILDDDGSFLERLARSLEPFYNILPARSISEAQASIAQNKVDVIVLDYYLGHEGDGHHFMDLLRQGCNQIPVIVISGQADLKMAIGFLKRQVQDFLEKPFSLREIRDSIDKLLKPSSKESDSPFVINEHTRKVTVEDKQILLTPTEFEILNYFLKNAGKRVKRGELISHIWGNEQVSSNTFDTHLLNLKKKLPQFACKLTSVYGAGYCYEP